MGIVLAFFAPIVGKPSAENCDLISFDRKEEYFFLDIPRCSMYYMPRYTRYRLERREVYG